MDNANREIANLIFELTNKLLFNEKKTVINIDDLSLYPSECHLMVLIEEGKNTNATKIAEYLGITKGALSQNILRLEKKDILIKEKDPNYKNELSLYFTPLGQKALKIIHHHKKQLFTKIDKQLTTFNENDKNIIATFLDKLINSFDH